MTEELAARLPNAAVAQRTEGLIAGNVVWLVLKNTVVQVVGRTFTVVCRYARYVLIVRFFGPELFGKFSLILTLLIFAETLLDFGYGEVFVREICQFPERRKGLLATLTCSKLVQVLISYAMLIGILVALRYPWDVLEAGLLAGLELVFFGGILVYRALFKAQLQMERDVAADVASSSVFVGLLFLSCFQRWGLLAIFAAYTFSRAIYFAISYGLGRRDFDLRESGWDLAEMRSKFLAILPFGLCLFTAVAFNSQDMVMLSKMDSLRSVGLYSTAYRFVYPLVAVAVALMAGMYPILSSCWGRRMDKLARLYQQGINVAAVLACATFCGVQASARALMSVWGPDAIEATLALRILGVAIVSMYLGSLAGPMFVVIGRRWLALAFGCVGVIINFSLNLGLIPLYGYVGSAVATTLTDFCLMIPAFVVVQRAIGYRLKWHTLLKAALAAAVSLCTVYQLGLWDTFAGGGIALAVYALGTLATRAIRPGQLRALVQSVRERV